MKRTPICGPGSEKKLPLPPIAKFKIENITVTRAPLLKIYYWEYLDIDNLNNKLDTEELTLQHNLWIPTTQINSKPFKVLLWLRNTSDTVMELRLRRIQNCDCMPLQTRVGFNQFRQLYHCPHRRLINIMQEFVQMKPMDRAALSVVAYFFLFGEHKLTYEINCPNDRVITFDFYMDIIGFDLQKCIITKELLPTDVSEFRRFVQPVWVRNITMQHLNFVYSSRCRGLRLINPNLTVPRQSVWPLMVEYRPSDYENELELTNHFDCVRLKFNILARGAQNLCTPEPNVPVEDYDCVDFSYVIYPNRLDFDMQLREQRSLLVCIRNYSQKCMEFRWQNYIINELFEISFDPSIFRLKQHHSKHCLVQLRVFDKPLNFTRIPTVLEVHRIFNKSTRIAKELLDEVESIDDPNWAQDSYVEHVFLQLNIKVNFVKENVIEPVWAPPVAHTPRSPRTSRSPFTSPSPQRLSTKQQKPSLPLHLAGMAMPKKARDWNQGNKYGVTTIFEKLFWEYLSNSDFMRKNKDPELTDELNYAEVLELYQQQPEPPKPAHLTKNEILKMLSQLLAEGLRELSKNWRFLPREQCV